MNSYLSVFTRCLLALFFSVSLCTVAIAQGEESPHVKFANKITLENLESHVWALSADSMMGRETGQPGSHMAGNYIQRFFEELGVPAVGDTTYRQTMTIHWLMWEENELFVGERKLRNNREYLALPAYNRDWEDVSVGEIVFAGYGIKSDAYSDMPDVDLKGKTVVVLRGEPIDDEGKSLVTGSEEESEWSRNDSLKLNLFADRGAELILMAEPAMFDLVRAKWRAMTSPLEPHSPKGPAEGYPGLIHLQQSVVFEMMGELGNSLSDAMTYGGSSILDWTGQSTEVDFRIHLEKEVRTLQDDNILGYIRGTDPERRDELIVVSAHYDHIGYEGDEIFNGANDNASGTAAVMEMGRALVRSVEAGYGPARSVLLLLLTGEEKGLLGSRYYVQNPVFPLEQTIANINIDMLGRTDKRYEEKGIDNYIYPIGTDRLSTEFHEIVVDVNERYSNLELDFRYNDPEDPNRYYFRSDHYNFAKNGIPAVFYFNGMNEDYHQTGDTADKMNYEVMTKQTRHIFHVLWELANREEAIQVDVFED
ncbi:MAG: M28 family peptidase [Saprospirales bacterium]|nr:MAG: M28 family peptidase [Saprospirales bacterium]